MLRPPIHRCRLVPLAVLLGAGACAPGLAETRSGAGVGPASATPLPRPALVYVNRSGDLPEPLHAQETRQVFGFEPAPAQPERARLGAMLNLPGATLNRPGATIDAATRRADGLSPGPAGLAAGQIPAEPMHGQREVSTDEASTPAPATSRQHPVRTTAADPSTLRRQDSGAGVAPRAAGAPSIEDLLGLQDQVALTALHRTLGFAEGAPGQSALAPADAEAAPESTAPAARGTEALAVRDDDPVRTAARDAAADIPATTSSPAPVDAPPDLPMPSPSSPAIVLRGPAERTGATEKTAHPTVDDIDAPPPPPELGLADAAGEASASPMASSLLGAGPVALADERLDRVRGGFVTAAGLQVSFGIERAVYVNGTLVSTTTLNVSGLGAGQGPAVQATPGHGMPHGLNVIQNGPGNTFTGSAIPAGALGTVVQNTLNDQKIQSITMINATVNSLQVLRAQNLGASLRGAMIDSLRR